MKKVFTLAAALMLAFSVYAEKIYFKTTSATSWWANDGAKIGALFKVGKGAMDYGMYAAFFTPVEGQSGVFESDVPENGEPFVAVQFLRYQSTATSPEEQSYWNATGLLDYTGEYNMFTATASGEAWDSTTGEWGTYTPGPGPVPTGDVIYFQTTEACNWAVDGAKIGAIFRTGMSDQDYGLFTAFFTDNGNGLYSAEIPANEEPWVSVQFLRYNPIAEKPVWADFWNGTGVEAFDGTKNMFTATDWGGGQLTTTGTWSVYTPTDASSAKEDEQIKCQIIRTIKGCFIVTPNNEVLNMLGVSTGLSIDEIY